jgi:hypothetical protein
MLTARCHCLKTFGLALAAAAAPADTAIPAGAHTLDALTRRLAASPRRREFKTVPMILDNRDLWDAEPLDTVPHYVTVRYHDR